MVLLGQVTQFCVKDYLLPIMLVYQNKSYFIGPLEL